MGTGDTARGKNGAPPKRDLTLPGIIAALLVVILIANFIRIPGCRPARKLFSLDDPAKAGVTNARSAAKWWPFSIALTDDASLWAVRGIVNRPVQNPAMASAFDHEVRLATDGTILRGQITGFDTAMDALITSPDPNAPWNGDSFDLFVSTAPSDEPVYRLTMDHAGNWRLARYNSPTFDLADAGTVVPLPPTATIEAKALDYGYELNFQVPLNSLGLPALKAESIVQMQIHQYRHGLRGSIVRCMESVSPGQALKADELVRKFQSVDIIAPQRLQRRTRTDVPRTDTPQIAFATSLDAAREIPFPALRTSYGDTWTNEPTRVTMMTDGTTLRVTAECSDRRPADMVTEFSQNAQTFQPYKDDSMEFFFLPSSDSAWYYQVIASNTGAKATYRFRNVPGSELIYRPWSPQSFNLKVTRDRGFTITFDVAVADLAMEQLQPGDSIRLQVVRNYRGQSLVNSVLLQLNPMGVYVDQDRIQNNHDRGCFQPATVVAE